MIKKLEFGGLIIMFLLFTHNVYAEISISDAQGHQFVFDKAPEQVVSLVPTVTEMLLKLGVDDPLVGVTYHSDYPREVAGKERVGGFLAPNLERIKGLNPEVIFYSTLQHNVPDFFAGTDVTLLNLDINSIEGSFQTLLNLGALFHRQEQAAKLVAENRRQLALIKQKVAKIPQEKRKRVMRMMGRDQMMTPGSDSFQNDIIRAAGGIPPDFVSQGNIVPVTLDQWQQFNPQVLYGCGDDNRALEPLLQTPGWQDAAALKEHQVFHYPCALTCRAGTNIGYFVKWLAGDMYAEEFAHSNEGVEADEIIAERKFEVPLSYIKQAKVVHSRIDDFIHKSLVVEFNRPLDLISTLEGPRHNITTVGNSYSPPPTWRILHHKGLAAGRKELFGSLGLQEDSASMLFTGANMDNLVVKHTSYRDMDVYALVTAGVKSNAVRMSRDVGGYYEPGTINIILLSNMQLSPRAMTRAIISATEAKSAAMQDLDIRSSYSGELFQATGTGTDNIIVVEGEGGPIDNAGGHSKMGELIASAVYQGVKDAVFQQNGIIPQRNIFTRLKDRGFSVRTILNKNRWPERQQFKAITAQLEGVLLDDRYAGFIAAAMALSDQYQAGLVSDLSAFDSWGEQLAGELAGSAVPSDVEDYCNADLPEVMKCAFNALLSGLVAGEQH